VYDGGTTATVTLRDDRLAGDVLTTGYTSAAFANKTVANGKPGPMTDRLREIYVDFAKATAV